MKINIFFKIAFLTTISLAGTTILAEQTNINVPDTTISSNVQSNLDNDKMLSGTHIQASSKQGVVTLEGTADNQAQVDEAVKATKGITGVTNVKLNITVKHISNVPDTTISSNVQTNIDNNKILAGTNIKATSNQGIVTLEGTVDTQAQVDEAVTAAKGITGVIAVKSKISIKTKTP